jgi:glutathione synthase/RimK-type ligase-like ATP-grasp enzyme
LYLFLKRRKSISGNWKTNLGSAMLEQTAMTDKYRSWIEAVSAQFGGLDLCALEILVARDGREVVMELNDCALPLLGDSQEEDRRLISELVLHRMNVSHTLTMTIICIIIVIINRMHSIGGDED